MSKLAHSNESSMLQIDIRSAIEDGNQDLILKAFDALKVDNRELRQMLTTAPHPFDVWDDPERYVDWYRLRQAALAQGGQ